MNDHKEHISHYSAADIQRYVQGKLSAAEMHAMEKAALDDPFLADAIEGMEQAFSEHKESLVTGQHKQLQQQFATRTASIGKVVAFKPFRYWQAASAAVVVIVAGVWIYSLVNNNVSENNAPVIAKTEELQPKPQQSVPAVADSAAAPATGNSQPAENEAFIKPEAKTGSHKNNIGKTVTTQPATVDNTVTSAAPPAGENRANISQWTDTAKVATTELADNQTQREVARKAAAPSAAPPAAVSDQFKKAANASDAYDYKSKERDAETELITIAKTDSRLKRSVPREKNLSGFIKGQVTDPFNNPVANAYVQIQKNNNNNFFNNYTTDKSGYFNIPVSDSVVNVAVNVSGYGTQNFILQNNAAVNQLQLQPANYASNNYAPTAPVKGKKLANSYKFPNLMVYEAEPVYGWVAFGQYLEKNKIIPPGTEGVTGNVVVSFEVNKKGILSDFKTEQSLSKVHDEEAIRLIKQGPSWKLRNGRKARITVMVRF